MSSIQRFKQFLIGKPIATKHAQHERLPKRTGLAVFASDALSSVAYATDEVLVLLVLGGMAAYYDLFPIALVLGVLLIIVCFSYYQTIHAYPEGGGSYSVSKANLGHGWGRIAGSALLIDYILTVAVSVSSGVGALISAVPSFAPYSILIGLGAVVALMYANLRGAKESGLIFAIPTYSFIIATLGLIGVGLYMWMFKGAGVPKEVVEAKIQEHHMPKDGWHEVTILFVLRAFAASCTAMTGVEAISNGVQAFKKPEAKNASQTLVMMAAILLVMFIGISWAAQHYGVVPMHSGEPGFKTGMAQIAATIYGDGSLMFYITQGATVAILFMAANTAFADFPRLASLLARDGYLPRSLMTLGDRLVFNNGIIALAVASAILIAAFKADTHSLVPLYAVGVFTAFTLSQAGMVVRWKKMGKAWSGGFILNLIGCLATGVVLVILAYTKFFEGAWVTIFAVGGVVWIFTAIRRHYHHLAKELSLGPEDAVKPSRTAVMLLVPRVHKGILKAISYCEALSNDCRAIHVTLDPKSVGKVKDDWNKFGSEIPLVILDSQYRSLVEPILEYVDQTIAEDPSLMVTVVVPQAIPKYPWQALLHSNAATSLKKALGHRRNVVITNVRYFLK